MIKIFEKLLSVFPSAKRRAAAEARLRDDEILRSIRDSRVVELGPAMGNVHSYAIPKWVKLSNGAILPYKGFVGDNFSIDSVPFGCVVIEPGLLYGSADGDGTDTGA